ncbi:hypothetical protein SLEP1_g25786 [Rubroshorea leprosula]|uniref:Uncharacterized protein n=1 Tax=Rubroshorea leprosula TaxID=152421 RepID=A0AAV5JWB6_9ROSI|nr:hypothetical protein SLEP1_g25786 [Rubroshorea leprosula]
MKIAVVLLILIQASWVPRRPNAGFREEPRSGFLSKPSSGLARNPDLGSL